MSRSQRFRPTGAAVVTSAVIGAIALAGCGAGQITQTSTQVPAVVGANAGNGPVVVRDAHIEFAEEAKGANIYPRGGAAPLTMSIVNTAGQADRLVSASSPVATSVEISGTADVPPGRVLLVEGEPAAAPAAPSAPASASAPAAPSAPASASASASATAGAGATQVQPSGEPVVPGDEIGGSGQEPGSPPPSSATAAAPTAAGPPTEEGAEEGTEEGTEGSAQVVLTGLKEDVRAGLTYPLVLNFEKAGQITLTVPVGYPAAPREDAHAE